jgi:hypothetical protein
MCGIDCPQRDGQREINGNERREKVDGALGRNEIYDGFVYAQAVSKDAEGYEEKYCFWYIRTE